VKSILKVKKIFKLSTKYQSMENLFGSSRICRLKQNDFELFKDLMGLYFLQSPALSVYCLWKWSWLCCRLQPFGLSSY